MSRDTMRFLENLQEHITAQLGRIAGEGEVRARLLQGELDQRFNSMDALLDERHGNQKEFIAQRFTDQNRLLDERYATQTKALDAAFKAAEQAVAVALANAEKATIKAEQAADKRFEGVNEFRKTLSDQTGTFIPRIEYAALQKAHEDKLEETRNRITKMESLTQGIKEAGGEVRAQRGLVNSNVMLGVMALSMIISVAAIIVSILVHAHP